MADKTVINFDEPAAVEQTARKEESTPAVGGKGKATEDKPAAQGGKDKAAEDKPAAQGGKDKAAEDKPAMQGDKDKAAEDKTAVQDDKDEPTEEVDSQIIDMEISIEGEQTIIIQPEDIDKLIDDFADHPFSIGTKEQQQAFAEDIAQNGVLQAAYVRPHPKDKGRYEMLAGHRRKNGAKMAKKPLPIIVRNYNDAQAIAFMVSTNFKSRQDVPLYERAKAFSMEYEAMKRQGQRSGQNVQKSKDGKNLRTIEILAEQYQRHDPKMNYKKMQKIIKCADLIPQIGNVADRLKFDVAYNLAFLNKTEQKIVHAAMGEELSSVSVKQGKELRDLSERAKEQRKPMQKEDVIVVLNNEVKKIDPVKLEPADIQKYFPNAATPSEMQGYILRLLERDYLLRKTKDPEYTPKVEMFKSNHVADKIQKVNAQAQTDQTKETIHVEPLARVYDKAAPAEPSKNNVVDISAVKTAKQDAPKIEPPKPDVSTTKPAESRIKLSGEMVEIPIEKTEPTIQAEPPAPSGQSVQKSDAKKSEQATPAKAAEVKKPSALPTPKPKKKR